MRIAVRIEGEVVLNVVHVEGKFISKDEIIDILNDHLDDVFGAAFDEMQDPDLQGIGDEGLSVYDIVEADGAFEVVLS